MKTGRHRILTHSNHKFGEPEVAKNAIVTTATLAVRPPSGTTAETSEFQYSREDIYDVQNPNTIWLTDCLTYRYRMASLSHPTIFMFMTSR